MSFVRSSGIHPNYPFLRPVLDDMFLVATPDPPSQRLQGLMQNLIGFPEGCALLKYIPSKEGSQSTSAKMKLTHGKFQESNHCFSKILPCWLQIGWVGSRSSNFNACGCGKFHQEQLWHENSVATALILAGHRQGYGVNHPFIWEMVGLPTALSHVQLSYSHVTAIPDWCSFLR